MPFSTVTIGRSNRGSAPRDGGGDGARPVSREERLDYCSTAMPNEKNSIASPRKRMQNETTITIVSGAPVAIRLTALR